MAEFPRFENLGFSIEPAEAGRDGGVSMNPLAGGTPALPGAEKCRWVEKMAEFPRFENLGFSIEPAEAGRDGGVNREGRDSQRWELDARSSKSRLVLQV